MASGGQEKSLNEPKSKFSITKPSSSAVQFLANQISTDKCKQILSGFHSLNAVLQEQTSSANIFLTLLWRFEAIHSVWSIVLLLSSDYFNRSKGKALHSAWFGPVQKEKSVNFICSLLSRSISSDRKQ